MSDIPITSWGQAALYVAVAVGIIVVAVAQLFKTMTATYGGIITNLQTQNNIQQTQLNNLEAKLAESEKRCDERLAALQKGVDEVKKAVNGGLK